MKKFKELTSEIEEAVIKRLDLAKLRKRSREQSIRMRRLMKNPAYKKKVELKKKRMKSTPELMVRAQKQARDMVRSKYCGVIDHKDLFILPKLKSYIENLN